MMRSSSIIPVITLALLFIACEKQTSWELQTSTRFPVVDCILTNEMKHQELRLYQSSGQLNEDPAGIRGAQIRITDGNHEYLFREDSLEAGRYFSSETFMASAGQVYQLVISSGDITDTALAEMTGITPLETIDIISHKDLYRIVYHESPQASMLEVFYDWRQDTAYTRSYGASQASETFYTLLNIDPEKEFAPGKVIIPFPKNTRIIRRKYSLSADHQNFIRELLLETEWRGGLFDAEPGDVPANFHHGIRGWFAVCMVISDTTFYK
jgi:hypothetical protein